MPIVHYDSLTEFMASLPEIKKLSESGQSRTRDDDAWRGGQTYTTARERIWTGDAEALRVSDALLEKLEADGIELAVSHWENDRTGFLPCVPSYLAGSPESMRRLTEYQTENSPIKIYADVCLSAHFEGDRLAQRGATLLALARKLQAIRPVELYLYASMHGKDARDGYGECAIPVIRIETSPLDLTTASYAMANGAFLRQLCFAWGDVRGFRGSWAWNGSPEDNRPTLIEHFGLADTDMLIDGAYATDKLMQEPLKWVNDQVKRYANVLLEDTA